MVAFEFGSLWYTPEGGFCRARKDGRPAKPPAVERAGRDWRNSQRVNRKSSKKCRKKRQKTEMSLPSQRLLVENAHGFETEQPIFEAVFGDELELAVVVAVAIGPFEFRLFPLGRQRGIGTGSAIAFAKNL